MKTVGIILILVVIILYLSWLWLTKHQKGVVAKKTNGVQEFDILVKGVYSPGVITAKMGKKIRINFHREESTDCSRFVNFPDWHIRRELTEGQTVAIELEPLRRGTFIFTCDMSMYQGKLIIE